MTSPELHKVFLAAYRLVAQRRVLGLSSCYKIKKLLEGACLVTNKVAVCGYSCSCAWKAQEMRAQTPTLPLTYGKKIRIDTQWETDKDRDAKENNLASSLFVDGVRSALLGVQGKD